MHRGAGIDDEVARVEFDALLATGVLHHQLAAVVVTGWPQKQRAGNLGAYLPGGGGMGAHRVVNVVAKVIAAAAAVTVEQRPEYRFRQGARHKHRAPCQRHLDNVPRLLSCQLFFWQ